MIKSPYIQVAGVRDAEEAGLLVQCGVKHIGFPFHLPVHTEDISVDNAAKIIAAFPADVNGVLITYLDQPAEIIGLCKRLGVSFVQLHGDIATRDLATVRKNAPNLKIIKSLVIGKSDTKELFAKMERSSNLVDAFITDTFDASSGADGATGHIHDWSISRSIVKRSRKPVILAGGLNPTNVTTAINMVGPVGVDSHTGVEGKDGRKDAKLVSEFVLLASKALEKVILVAPSKLDLDTAEVVLQSTFLAKPFDIGELTIDLTACTFMSVPALVYILSVLDWRSSRSLKTVFLLPASKRVRDFMRLWGFPEAVFDYTGREFLQFCTPEQVDMYFGESPTGQTYYRALSKVQDQLINDRFFAISTYQVNAQTPKDVVTATESSRWKAPLIIEFLRSNLDGKPGAGLVASRVVYEAMTNAIRHPNASLISAASFCENREGKERLLTITFWDNGQSMVDTIGIPAKEGKQIRVPVADEKQFCFRVDLVTNSHNIRTYTRSSADDIAGYQKESDFLLACLYPGVSRDILRQTYIPSTEFLNQQLDDHGPGHGLTDLLNCVCDIFGGTVRFATSTVRIFVKKSEPNGSCKYAVTMTEYSNRAPPFNGNLLVVEIPLGSRQ